MSAAAGDVPGWVPEGWDCNRFVYQGDTWSSARPSVLPEGLVISALGCDRETVVSILVDTSERTRSFVLGVDGSIVTAAAVVAAVKLAAFQLRIDLGEAPPAGAGGVG